MNRTIQREAILNELRNCSNHPTADELYEILRKKVPQISLGTVYRNLEDMAQRGVIRKLELAGRQKRFDGRTDHHYHLRCRKCDMIVDLRGSFLDKVDKIFEETMHKIGCDTVHMEWGGICPDCRRREKVKVAMNQVALAKIAVAAEV